MDREGETDSKRELYEPYWAALNNDWESVKDFYKKHARRLSYPITASMDNGFHLATFSERKEPLQSLLNISENDLMMRYGYLERNRYGNTPLHEAAANGNLEAVQALVNHHRKLSLEDFEIEDENELLEAANTKAETPLFMAAAFGSTGVVKFLASKSLEKLTRDVVKEGQREKVEYFKLKETHRQHIRLINVEPASDASHRLSRVIQSEIILKPKPGASNQLSSVIPSEIILKPKTEASNQLSGTIRGEIILEPKHDASDQLSSAIQGEITLEPKPDAFNQLSGAIRGEIILKPKPGATQKETSKKEPDVSTQLSSARRGEVMLEAKPDAPNQLFGAFWGKIILEPKPGQKRVPDASILHVAIAGHHFETALYLLNRDESLATVRDLKGWTSLHLLATMPSAFESGHQWGTWIHRVLYFCLPKSPIDLDADNEKATSSNISKGLSNGDNQNASTCLVACSSNGDNQNATSCWIACSSNGDNQNATSCLIACSSSSDKATPSKISKGWLILVGKICELVGSNILKEKRKHELAFHLAERLIKNDSSWDETINRQVVPSDTEEDQSSGDYKPIPLLLATERGIVEIVNKILDECPQLVEHINDLDQNILHVAIKHRQYDIFNNVINMKIPMKRLVRKVDKNGYTILHHAADMDPETTKIHPAGPVYQLQEEIKWYKRVEKVTPTYYAMLLDKKEHKTCEEIFNMKHNDLLEKARKWTKDTSQSCSAVAVLVATVVFAAAYTVPGGSNEKGYPIFLNSRLFLLFTVMDVIALACSLTSVVMFLSVLTSPYTYREFLLELPRKLTIGFSLLFISLAATMIAFAATLLLIIRSEKPHWTTTLIYTAAFFPVSIFALMNFPMYAAFQKTLFKLYRRLSKSRCVTKPSLPKKPGSNVDQPAPNNPVASGAAPGRRSNV